MMRHRPLLVSLLIGGAMLASCGSSSGNQANDAAADPAATAAPARSASGIDLAGIDHQVRPGDDFDAYANGAWRAKAQIPADRSSTGPGLKLTERAEARTAAIIRQAAASSPKPGTDAARIADYYAAYMDTLGIERRGLEPVRPELAAIAAIGDKTELATALGSRMRADTDPLNDTNFWTQNLFGLWVTQSLDHPGVNVPYLLQGGLGLPDRDYYLSAKPDMAAIRTAYTPYVAQILKLAGFADADSRAQRIVALEHKIAAAQESVIESQDVHKADNPWTRADFAKKAPGLDWNAFWTAAELPNQQDFVVWQPSAVTGLSALVASEPLDVWKDWLAFHMLNQLTDVLPTAFDQAHFAFYGTRLSGIPQQRPREKRAVVSVDGAMGDAVGKLYAERYFPASSKQAVEAIVHNLLAAFRQRVSAIDWMAPATKAEALKKIATMRVSVGYPDHWRDYSSYIVRVDDPVGNLERARLVEYRHQIGKIGKPVDRGEWWMTPQTVNAVNLPLQNALNFPAAILEPPYFDPKADPAANYGSIGAIIGHEISHSFDNTGALFTAEGKLSNWWTPADFRHFEQAGAKLVAQFDAYQALPGLHLPGKQELGENIADLAGLNAAYDAYHASLGSKPAPVVDGLTGDQRFFLAFGQSWRSKMRDAALRQEVTTDVHAPARFRAQTVRNLDAWYPAFAVKPGEQLYLTPTQRVRIW